MCHGYGLVSYALFDMDGRQVPQQLVTEVGELFERILKEVSCTHYMQSFYERIVCGYSLDSHGNMGLSL